MPSAIVPLRFVLILAAKLMLLIRLPSSSIKDGFGSNIRGLELEGDDDNKGFTVIFCNFSCCSFSSTNAYVNEGFNSDTPTIKTNNAIVDIIFVKLLLLLKYFNMLNQ